MGAVPSAQQKIALFGGTFDPVHDGHLHIADLAREAFKLDEIRWIPCWISPHKQDRQPAPAADRLQMLRLATANCPWSVVDPIEIERRGPSYSIDTAREMSRRFPDARLFWIMGTDQWNVLPSWAESEKLADLVEFIVISRGDAPKPRKGFRLHPLHATHPASATEIRNTIAAESPPRWLAPAVLDWIESHRLYQNGIKHP